MHVIIKEFHRDTENAIGFVPPVDSGILSKEYIDRNRIRFMQTPQPFPFDITYECHEKYRKMRIPDDTCESTGENESRVFECSVNGIVRILCKHVKLLRKSENKLRFWHLEGFQGNWSEDCVKDNQKCV
jgi:hypothetical protein